MSSASSLVVERIVEGRQRRTDDVDRIDQRRYDRSSRAGAVIERLNLTIAPGTFLGVSGPTGAGKTTFADLLTGLIEPDSGEIEVGGVLRGAAAVKWRDRVSYVVQDPYLFRDTIRRNLLWANPQASDAEIWDALAIAGVDGFVTGLTAGLDTMLGERGTLISGASASGCALPAPCSAGPSCSWSTGAMLDLTPRREVPRRRPRSRRNRVQ